MSSKFGQMRPLVSMTTDRVTVGKWRHHVFSNVFNQIHFILAGNDNIQKSLNELKFGEIRPWTTELAALERLKKKSYTLIIEKMTSSHFSTIFHLILFILAGNEDMHKSLDDF